MFYGVPHCRRVVRRMGGPYKFPLGLYLTVQGRTVVVFTTSTILFSTTVVVLVAVEASPLIVSTDVVLTTSKRLSYSERSSMSVTLLEKKTSLMLDLFP